MPDSLVVMIIVHMPEYVKSRRVGIGKEALREQGIRTHLAYLACSLAHLRKS
ncbi:MAG: hypothetical protein R6V59_09515 [Dehalococcoidia bacterium]